MDFPIPPEFWWSTDILLIINSSTGMDQEINPCGQGRSASVKINPSLLRMREWPILTMILLKANACFCYFCFHAIFLFELEIELTLRRDRVQEGDQHDHFMNYH